MYPYSTQYPAAADLLSFLRASGMLRGLPADGIPTYEILGYALASAIGEWERVTKWQPFAADAAPSARVFDSPLSAILDLEGGVVDAPTVMIGTSAYTLGQQYTMGPKNALARGLPVMFLDFSPLSSPQGYGYSNSLGYLPSGRLTVSVTGTWGYCKVIPPDVRQAILQEAACQLAPSLAIARFGGLVSWTEEGVSENYGRAQYSDMADSGAKAFQNAAMRYRRITFGG